MTLAEISEGAGRVSDIYARNHGIERGADWTILKLQEEIGELTQAHLRLSGRGRGAATEDDRANEAADVLCQLLLYCRQHDIDLEAAVQRKWFAWLEPAA